MAELSLHCGDWMWWLAGSGQDVCLCRPGSQKRQTFSQNPSAETDAIGRDSGVTETAQTSLSNAGAKAGWHGVPKSAPGISRVTATATLPISVTTRALSRCSISPTVCELGYDRRMIQRGRNHNMGRIHKPIITILETYIRDRTTHPTRPHCPHKGIMALQCAV